MRQLPVFIAVLIVAAITPAKVESSDQYFGVLPTEGQGFFYLCGGAKLTKMTVEGATTKYQFNGTCTIVVRDPVIDLPLIVNDVPVVAKGSYDGVFAKEIVKLVNGSSITSTKRCNGDPFRFGTSGCPAGDPNNAINISPLKFVLNFELMIPRDYPLMSNNATEQAIAASSGLVEADPEAVDLSDWNPFAEGVSEPAAIELQTPAPYATLPTDTAYDVAVSRKRGSGEPANILVLVERLEEAPKKVGDVALPADKTHWWVPQWSSSVTWRSLPFQVGVDRATKGLANDGIYRVRVRATQASGGHLGGWTGWRVYCVGGQEACANAKLLSQLGDKTQALFHQSLREKGVIRKP